MIVPATAQQAKGIATHLTFLNMSPRATTIKSTTTLLNVRKSPCTKVTKSSAIIGAPPRYICAPSRWLSKTALMLLIISCWRSATTTLYSAYSASTSISSCACSGVISLLLWILRSSVRRCNSPRDTSSISNPTNNPAVVPSGLKSAFEKTGLSMIS